MPATGLASCTGFFAGIFQLLVVKHGSAALMVVGFAITVPLSDVAFAIPAFMGSEAKRLNGCVRERALQHRLQPGCCAVTAV